MHDPRDMTNEFDREFPEGCNVSDRASFSRAHASNAEPNCDAAVERAERASRYALALSRSSA